MRKSVLLIATLTLSALWARASAWGQESAAGSLALKGASWKKGEVLPTSVNVEFMQFSADGRTLLLASPKGVSVWDWKNDKERLFFSFPKGTRLSCLSLSADGKYLATGHLDSMRVLIWDVSKGEIIRQLNHGAPVSALAFSIDGKQLASGGGHPQEEKVVRDTQVQIWNVADGQPGPRYFGLDRPVRTIALAANLLTAEDARGQVLVWNRVSGTASAKLSTHAFVMPLAMIGSGRTLIGYEVGDGRFLTRWDSALEKKERLIDMSPTNQGSRHGFWSNADGSLAATSHPGEIIVWDLKTKDRRSTLTIPRESEVLALAFAPDSDELTVALSNETVLRLAVEKGR